MFGGGSNASDLEPIKPAENTIYRLPSSTIVVRVAKPGQEAAAERELLSPADGADPKGPIHGDAWEGDVVTTADGTTLPSTIDT
ncbi:hypothetical protein [Nocardia jiangsuensis]|uniref:Uncharacterized protein n=1 Tax=Nocardia jiangsuensis TaxID=1691563 RepID=A0ABV8DY14_9NOCA